MAGTTAGIVDGDLPQSLRGEREVLLRFLWGGDCEVDQRGMRTLKQISTRETIKYCSSIARTSHVVRRITSIICLVETASKIQILCNHE